MSHTRKLHIKKDDKKLRSKQEPLAVTVFHNRSDDSFIETLRQLSIASHDLKLENLMPSDVATQMPEDFADIIDDTEILIIGDCNDSTKRVAKGEGPDTSVKEPIAVAEAFIAAKKEAGHKAPGIIILTSEDSDISLKAEAEKRHFVAVSRKDLEKKADKKGNPKEQREAQHAADIDNQSAIIKTVLKASVNRRKMSSAEIN